MAANYEAITVTRKVASAGTLRRFFQSYLWIIFHPLTELLLVLTLMFNWNLSLFRRKNCCWRSQLLHSFAWRPFIFCAEKGVIAVVNFADSIDFTNGCVNPTMVGPNLIRPSAYYAIGELFLIAVNRNITRLEESAGSILSAAMRIMYRQTFY